MRQFKIEYEPDYKTYRYKIYRSYKYRWFFKGWELMGSYETEEEARKEIDIVVMFPKVFEGDTKEGIYNND